MRKSLNQHKKHLLHKGHDFFSSRHNGSDYFSILRRQDGYYELFKNGEHEPSVLVICDNCKLVAIGRGNRKGYSNTIHLKDVEFLDFDFDKPKEENSPFVSVLGEPLYPINGELIEADSYFIEASLF